MNYLSVCSGIEAASVAWHPMGWQPWAFSEIDKFPSAVLAQRYPQTPNLGNMTKYQEWPDAAIDLLVGGTPCQSFSVAGLRKGLADPRGNLMLTYGAIAGRYRPQWLVWENVPGVLSSNGGRDFSSFLDMLEELGYVCDIEILDAQFFGVPQRRRRVFVCGQHRDDLLKQKTDSSALTIAQCLQEILHGILIEASSRFGKELENSGLAYLSRDGVKRRMRLFGILGGHENWPLLRSNLVEAFLRHQVGQSASDAPRGGNEKERMPEGRLMDSSMASLFTLTEQSLKTALDDAYQVMKLFITSTPTNSTTQSQIFTCSKAALLIGRLILLLNQSSPPFWSAASSCLIAIEEFIDYARHASSDLFGDVERVQAWLDFIVEADGLCESIGDIGIECFGSILPVPHSLSGHPAPRRETRKAIAGTITRRTLSSVGADDAANGHLIAMAHGQAGAEITRDYAPSLTCNHEAPLVAHTLKGHGFDASEDGTGRGTPLVAVAIQERAVCENPDAGPGGAGFRTDGCAYTLEARSVPQAIVFDTTQITSAANYSAPKPGDPCHPLAAGAHPPTIAFDSKASGQNGFGVGEIASTQRAMGHADSHTNGGGHQAVLTGSVVRRLTPKECARVQGFPDDYLDIPYRGKPAADGPKYKALGNSMAVPVMRWIGQRIAAVDQIELKAAA